VLFLNPDAAPAPGCLDALRSAARSHPDWGAWQALVVMDGGAAVNTRGGVTHFLGFGWAGGCGEPVSELPDAEVGFASGAALCVRRSLWERVDGFDDDYFMYGEDLDLSLRAWLAGFAVGIAPGAVVEHDYDFHKGGYKWYLLELNRWRTVIGDYPGALLALLAPALVAFELALLPVAARGGWLREKLRAQAMVARSLPGLLRRRRRVQALRRASAGEFARRLTSELDSPYLALPEGLAPLLWLQAAYWRLVLALLR
jgi:GT2 family glycosyltransferase